MQWLPHGVLYTARGWGPDMGGRVYRRSPPSPSVGLPRGPLSQPAHDNQKTRKWIKTRNNRSINRTGLPWRVLTLSLMIVFTAEWHRTGQLCLQPSSCLPQMRPQGGQSPKWHRWGIWLEWWHIGGFLKNIAPWCGLKYLFHFNTRTTLIKFRLIKSSDRCDMYTK